jgi:hypothetical protein
MKKRNKKYTPRLLITPKIIQIISVNDVRPDIKLLFHTAVMAFTVQPTHATCNQISSHLCKIAGAMSLANNGEAIDARKDKCSVAICDAINVIESVGARFDLTSEVSISDSEIKVLRKCAGVLDGVLSRLPAACYERAENEVHNVVGEAA